MQVIFVDADQVVRTDMGELYDMDIKGRPLAYTPFCDNNKDMDGYRFWRQVVTLLICYSFAQHLKLLKLRSDNLILSTSCYY